MDTLQEILIAFEIHSPEKIRIGFENGISPNQIVNGKPLVYEFINMYYRSPKFSECLSVFIEFGLEFEDEVLLSVLLNDGKKLEQILKQNKNWLTKKYNLNCTFTPLFQAPLLHICAEYNLVEAARVLIKNGADINATAGKDENGFGGQSAIFHTVNQHKNNSIQMLNLLLSYNADLSLTVRGLIWGKGYDWETFIPDINPVSYAMMGLLRQFQRTEEDIYEVIDVLMKSKYNLSYSHKNIPNKYLNT